NRRITAGGRTIDARARSIGDRARIDRVDDLACRIGGSGAIGHYLGCQMRIDRLRLAGEHPVVHRAVARAAREHDAEPDDPEHASSGPTAECLRAAGTSAPCAICDSTRAGEPEYGNAPVAS